jgi:hypothetical protein
MPTHTPMLADRRGRGVILTWRGDLGFGHVRTHTGEIVRFDLAARQAGLWPQVGEEVTFGFAACPKTGDPLAVGLRLTSPRRAQPPARLLRLRDMPPLAPSGSATA